MTSTQTSSPLRSWQGQTLRLVLLLIVAAIVAENAIAWTYVLKRRMTGYPVVDLVERFYVLRPFRFAFPDQYQFPSELWPNLKGDISVASARRQFWIADPLLGHRLAPSALTLKVTWTWRATNSQGFIMTDPDAPLRTYAPDKPPGVYRIVVLGGSTVEGDGATGSLAALPAQLLRLLRAGNFTAPDGGLDIEVVNAGIGGYRSHQELLYYLSELYTFHPDLVISYGGWNDERFAAAGFGRLGAGTPRFFNESTEMHRRILNGYYDWSETAVLFFARSATRLGELLDGVALLHTAARAATRLLPARTSGQASLAPPDAMFRPESVDRYVANVGLLAREALARDTRVAWFLQPLVGLGAKPLAAFHERAYDDGRMSKIEHRRAFFALARQRQGELARELDDDRFCAADLTDVFDGNTDAVYEDFGHLGDIGNDIVARRIISELVRCGMIGPPAPKP